ncbi:MAG: hypothetical protein GY847_30155 [Proteobacteria bacterium]|nr:hypothetical protein [Pseudomonadota bacterium]
MRLTLGLFVAFYGTSGAPWAIDSATTSNPENIVYLLLGKHLLWSLMALVVFISLAILHGFYYKEVSEKKDFWVAASRLTKTNDKR